jgi:hypothetical protein
MHGDAQRGNCQKHHEDNHKSRNQKRRPHWQLRYCLEVSLSRPNSSTCTGGKKRNALSDLAFYQINIDELATFVGIIAITLSNVTVLAHSLNVGTVGAVVTTKFVMCLGITNIERQLEVQPHVTYMGYPHHMAVTPHLQSKKTLNYTFQTSMIVFRLNMLASHRLSVSL